MRYFLLLAAPALLFGAARPLSRPASLGPTRATAAPAAPAAPGTVLSNAARHALLARANLGRLWQHQPQSGPEDVLNGCFGYDGRRLEFVFLSVQPDAHSPGRYLVAGKFRCYGDVTPFRGSIEVQQVQRLPAEAEAYNTYAPSTAPTYCATGSFALHSTNCHGLGGQFSGRIALDFQVSPSQRAVLIENTTNPVTRRGGLLFEGAWREDAAGAAVPAVWKQGVAVTHQVLSRFQIGERDVVINPKYARVGWNSFWKNDEWWTEKAVARR